MQVDELPVTTIASAAEGTSIPLCDLRVGETARFHQADVDGAVARFLRAVGLTRTSEVRLCKNGEPCIIQVRSTRIGLSRTVARRIFVVPMLAPRTGA